MTPDMLTMYHGTRLDEATIRREGLKPQPCQRILDDIKKILGVDELPKEFEGDALVKCAPFGAVDDNPEVLAAHRAGEEFDLRTPKPRTIRQEQEARQLDRRRYDIEKEALRAVKRPIFATGNKETAENYANFLIYSGEAVCLAIEELVFRPRYATWRRSKGLKREPPVCAVVEPKVVKFRVPLEQLNETCQRDYRTMVEKEGMEPEEATRHLNGRGCRIDQPISPEHILEIAMLGRKPK